VTTIAYRDGILAADTQSTFGHIRIEAAPKIVEVHNGTLFAGAGDLDRIALAQRFFENKHWEDNLSEAPIWEDGFQAILYTKGRLYWMHNNCVPISVQHPFFAIGSGSPLAMAAMHTGMSAPEAVLLASELDIYTNNKVQIVNVQDVQKEAVAKRAGRTISRKAASKAIN